MQYTYEKKPLDPETVARRITQSGNNLYVTYTTGDDAPRIAGRGYYFTTPGGRLIFYPNSYKWPKVYQKSTRHIAVGRRWISRNRGWHRDNIGWYVRPRQRRRRLGYTLLPALNRKGAAVWIIIRRGHAPFHANVADADAAIALASQRG